MFVGLSMGHKITFLLSFSTRHILSLIFLSLVLCAWTICTHVIAADSLGNLFKGSGRLDYTSNNMTSSIHNLTYKTNHKVDWHSFHLLSTF